MPISVRCKCGHAMNVPDSAAGKVGKCPKCQQPIKVPGGTASSGAAKPAVAKAPAAKPSQAKPSNAVPATATSAKLDQLFAQAGLNESKGPTCPSCAQPIIPNSAICINCGFHFERGEKIEGVKAVKQESEFDNLYLEEASRNIVRDQEAENRVKFAGAPWWVSLALVLGMCTVIFAGVTRIQAADLGEFAAEGTILFAFQKMPWVTLLPFVGVLVSSMVVLMSWIAVAVGGFRENAAQGFLVLFIPFYSIYYSIVNRIRLSTAANVHLLWWGIYVVFLIWFFANRGQRFF